MAMDPNATIQTVEGFWDARPCNINHSNKPLGTKEYFDEVEAKKYTAEPHIPAYADFDKYKGKRVLEVGCGLGTAAVGFCRAGAIYTGVDLSGKSVELARQRLEVYGLKGEIIKGNIEELEIEGGFDLVYSFGVLHHTVDFEKAVERCRSLIRPGGEFKVMLYAKNSWKSIMIEAGLDQYEAQANVPIALVFTDDEIKHHLRKFEDIHILQTHIFRFKIDQYKKYPPVYEEEECFKAMSPKMKEALEAKLGWHLCITCKRPLVD